MLFTYNTNKIRLVHLLISFFLKFSMKPIKWPPELDAVKMERESILGRIKNTDIWIDLSMIESEVLNFSLSPNLQAVYDAWAGKPKN